FADDQFTNPLIQVFDSKNASAIDGRTLSVVTPITITDTNDSTDATTDYTILTATATGTINTRPLNVTATAHSADKQYNGKTDAPGQAITDDRAVINTLSYDVQVIVSTNVMDKAAPMKRTVTLSAFTIASGNTKDTSVLATTATTAAATITPRPLNVTATA